MVSWNVRPRATCLAFSAENDVVVAGLVDGRVMRRRIDGEGKLSRIKPVGSASSVALSANGKHLAVGNQLGAIWLWNHKRDNPASTGDPQFASTWNAHDGKVTKMAFAPQRNDLVSVGEDGKLICWHDTASQGFVLRIYGSAARPCVASFSDRPLVVIPSTLGLAVLDVRDGSIVFQLTSELLDWSSVAVASEAHVIAAARKNGEIWVWRRWEMQSEQPAIVRLEQQIDAITISRDGRLLAVQSANANAGLVLFDLANGEKRGGFVAQGCGSAAISPDGNLLAVGEHGSDDIFVWNIKRHELLHRFDHHHDTVSALAFSPDSQRSASLDHSSVLTLWDIAAGRPLWKAITSPGAENAFRSSVAFSRSGRSVVATNALGLVGVWHVASGRELLVLDETARHMTSLSFCDWGRHLCGVRSNYLYVLDTGLPVGAIPNR